MPAFSDLTPEIIRYYEEENRKLGGREAAPGNPVVPKLEPEGDDDEFAKAYEETLRRLQEGMTASWSRSIGPAITRAERMV